uniref:(California timema) hypothetical protein n=1 Tax=Timema californicum TaxID=61474 RepID=A0A7R9JBJ5_TIMCA|nr:unnamed protein product [Timema californicum]
MSCSSTADAFVLFEEREQDSLNVKLNVSSSNPINGVITILSNSSVISEDVFYKTELKNIYEFTLKDTEVQQLPKNFTTNLINLTILNLENNKLVELPPNISCLANLAHLNVSCNNFRTLSEDVSHLLKLIVLNVNHNTLSDIPKTIGNLKNLKVLKMSENNLYYLPESLGDLKNLEKLDVSKNILECLPNSIGNLSKLFVLNISQNKLTDIPESFKNLCLLNCLNISHNIMEVLPECLIELPNISNLNVSHNKLQVFNEVLKCAEKLITLDLSYNDLKIIPKWLFTDHCIFLRDLIISHNHHMTEDCSKQEIFDTGAKYVFKKNLKILKASNCNVTTPSLKFLEGLQGLEVLDMSNDLNKFLNSKLPKNMLWEIQVNTLNWSVLLKELWLSNVGLVSVPEDLTRLTSLEVLDLSYNELNWLPDSFCRLKTLKKCKLSKNELAYLPAECGQLEELQEFNLDGNKLCSLPGSFANLTKLYFCDLYDNLLDAAPVELQKLLLLQSLDLEYNHFSTSDLLEKNPENEFFSKYETLKTNLRQQREFYYQRYNCQRPEESPDYNNTSEDATDNELEDVSSGSFAEPPTKDLSWWPSSSGPPSKENETWDRSDSSDDSFDPHREPMIQQKMSVWDPMSQSDPHLHRENFCPADMHQKSIRSKKKVTLPNPVEGQFEDACFDDTDANPTNIRFLLKDNL